MTDTHTLTLCRMQERLEHNMYYSPHQFGADCHCLWHGAACLPEEGLKTAIEAGEEASPLRNRGNTAFQAALGRQREIAKENV